MSLDPRAHRRREPVEVRAWVLTDHRRGDRHRDPSRIDVDRTGIWLDDPRGQTAFVVTVQGVKQIQKADPDAPRFGEDGKPSPTRVRLGLADGQYAEVLEGLSEGAQVITGLEGQAGTRSAARPGSPPASTNPFAPQRPQPRAR